MNTDYNQRLAKIEEYIFNILPEKADLAWIRDISCISDPEKALRSFLFDNINKPALDLVTRGGKRWRPMVMVLLCEARCGSMDKALPLTPLVELAHNGSLIIDDIEDNADLRRGKPAVHLIHGTDMAINSANFLYFLSQQVIEKSDFPDEIKLKLYIFYSQAMRRLHLGQGLDIQWHGSSSFIPDEGEYLQMCRFKTGSLSRLAAEAGVTAAGGNRQEAFESGLACEEMGVGFQILDDITNLTAGNPGKKRGDDIVEGKKSLPVILFTAAGGDKETLFECFREAGELGIEKGEEAVERAIKLLEKKNSIEKAREKALEILNNSRMSIEKRYPKCRALDLMGFIFDTFTKAP
ncbi:MAG: polyprenyl synthetase family protein [Spirochaetia bacterium]|jgi:octaprenyl-diphosphate synthase|nr:polyprenyl synthetase family protein [Spirochaetia bacterium]